MYYLNDKQRAAVRYFQNVATWTEDIADNAIKFCCSVCGCNREEQEYMLNWYFDGYAADMVHFNGNHGLFWRLLDYCGDAYIVGLDDPLYWDYRDVLYDGCQIAGEVLPTGRLFVYDI